MARRYTRQGRCPTDGQFISTKTKTEEEEYRQGTDTYDSHYCEDVTICRIQNGRYATCSAPGAERWPSTSSSAVWAGAYT
jgi:hypothetical protein